MKDKMMGSVVPASLRTTGSVARATIGCFAHGYGIKCKALAGAGVALPSGSISPATKHREISFTLLHGFAKRISGPNPLEGAGRQTITLQMNQWEFEIGYSF
ncbi:MAG: hypothetical protein ONB48_09170 [candidate division KSB1 bacterium]|nr:hypothetical protein [candidate division KSB1 bacterium]MDZ7273657.1 hypothetical protein [candidate division KSB1 bacterium]MDZ7285813.1 hypothetical protein [candidate division KSB1 bacterium]MDZ7298845.1 hypothetical protein [candidate division KSB1 bacterium]MDZ7350010.1 hypothetical protein [candidate division KSB1 bacterium]